MTGRGLVLSLVGAGLLLLGACGWEIGRNVQTDDVRVDDRISKVRLGSDSGDVTIRTGGDTTVRRTAHYDGERPGATHRVDGDVLVLGSCDVRNCWVDYEVTVPAGTTVDGDVDSGDVEVIGLGAVNLRMDSGTATLRDTSGDVNVVADSGDVTIELSTPGNVRAEMDSGNVTVTVPRGAYQVAANADGGSIDNGIAHDPTGSHRIDLRADSGDITVRYGT